MLEWLTYPHPERRSIIAVMLPTIIGFCVLGCAMILVDDWLLAVEDEAKSVIVVAIMIHTGGMLTGYAITMQGHRVRTQIGS